MTSQSQISSLKNKKIPYKKFENNCLFGESNDDESKDESFLMKFLMI